MLFEECSCPLPCDCGRFCAVGRLRVREKSVSCTRIDKDLVVAIILLQSGFKFFQLGKWNLCVLFGVMALDGNCYARRDIDGIHLSTCERGCPEISVKRHHGTDFFWIGCGKHERTSTAEAESGDSYAIRFSKALLFRITN